MQCFSNNIYHIFNQGNNRQAIFLNQHDYITFLNLYKKNVAIHVETIAWSLMPNHFHFMIATDERLNRRIKQGRLELDPLTNGFRKLLGEYAHIFNYHYKKTGSLFRQKTKCKYLAQLIDAPNIEIQPSPYVVSCFHYIHQNAIVARLVNRMEDWKFDSFCDYAGVRKGQLCNKKLAIANCNFNPDTFLADSNELIDQKIARGFS